MAAPAEQYPWYMPINNSTELAQGDLIENYEGVWDFDIKTQEAISETYNLIVMSQSCDIANNKIPRLVLCPVLTFGEAEQEWQDIDDTRRRRKS